jgi:hypothetical protein
MADVVERLPFPISKRLASAVTEVTARNGRELHYTIAGVPFRVATSPQMPLTLETAQMQKQQQDQEQEAGEQTLSGWWLRSQVSWHEGAGALFSEPRGDVTATSQFRESSNVDVWTQGRLSLLHATVDAGGTTNRSVAVIPLSTAHSVVAGRVGSVVRYTNLDVSTATTNLYINGAVTFTQVIATETDWYAAGNDGKVYSGPIGALTGSPLVWTLASAGSGPTRIAWAKHRLWAVNGNKIYELTYTAPGVETAVYTHPATGWVYSDVTDGPGGILFSGYGDGTSHIQRITLDADGSVPVLSGATTLAILPSDEKALRINSLAGSMICILTNMGVRVAVAQTSGDLVYGPLFLERDVEVPETVTPSLASAGRFWWLSFGDETKLWRIDSSTEVEEGIFAYASDMETSSAPTGVSARHGRAVVSEVSGAVAYQHATNLCASGYIQTGRIRFRTDELKTYHYVDVTTDPLEGSVTLDLLTDSDSEIRVLTWDVQGRLLPSAQVPTANNLQRYMSVKLTLQRATDPVNGPVILGVRMKALPAGRPQRIYTLPLLCYDSEQWSNGQEEGYEGFGLERYLSVRAAEDAGGIVLLVNYNFPAPQAELCRIEEMKFVQLQQPDDRQLAGGYGGILVVTLRTLT